MKKNIILVAESFFKNREAETETKLKTDSSWGGSQGVGGELVLRAPDAQTPKLRQVYLVSVEAVDLNPGEHPREGYERILKEAEEKDALVPGAGRKFR